MRFVGAEKRAGTPHVEGGACAACAKIGDRLRQWETINRWGRVLNGRNNRIPRRLLTALADAGPFVTGGSFAHVDHALGAQQRSRHPSRSMQDIVTTFAMCTVLGVA